MAKKKTPYKWTNRATKIIAVIIVLVMAISAIFVTLASGFQHTQAQRQQQEAIIEQLQEQISEGNAEVTDDWSLPSESNWPTFEKNADESVDVGVWDNTNAEAWSLPTEAGNFSAENE